MIDAKMLAIALMVAIDLNAGKGGSPKPQTPPDKSNDNRKDEP